MAVDPIEIRPTNTVAQWKTVEVSQSARRQVCFALTNSEGRPIDLTEEYQACCSAPAPTFVNSLPVQQNNVTVRLRARDGFAGQVIFDEPGVIASADAACKGLVSFVIQTSDTFRPGVYQASIGRFAGQYLVDEWPVFVAVKPSIFAPFNCGPNEILTVAELRLSIRDLQVGEISLLDALEFSDAEIMKAMRDAVDLWNETPPYLRGCTFTPSNFPWRVMWQTGATAYLLAMAARAYDRNDLQYGAGGTQINDQAKGPAYQRQADAMKQEYMAWILRRKREINMKRAWSST